MTMSKKKNGMRWGGFGPVALAVWLAVFSLAGVSAARAADVPAQTQVRLQGAMVTYLDQRLVDGAYRYIDTQQDVVRTVYPANTHPFVLPFGDDYFVCSEMIDDQGNTITADFLVRAVDDDFAVVQMIIDDRQSVQAVMKKGAN
jgi:hypothetical protein